MAKPENVKCPECDGPMKPRNGKFGVFWGCANYPRCKGTRDSMGQSKDERRGNSGDAEYGERGAEYRWNR